MPTNQPEMKRESEHGIENAFWSNYGGDRLLSGWVIECLCGWQTGRNHEMADTGGEFDDHLTEHKEVLHVA